MAIVNKAYKCRLYPDKNQQVLLAKTFGCTRKVYNLMLEETNRLITKNGQIPSINPRKYFKDYPYLDEVDYYALYTERFHLSNAFKAYRKDKGKILKFKSRKKLRMSYTTCNQNGSISLEEGFVILPIIGKVRIRGQRMAPKDWKLKTATVSMDSDGRYYVAFLYEYVLDIRQVPISDNAIGLDYKADGLYMASTGKGPQGIQRFFRRKERLLARVQRLLTLKVPGSKSYLKLKRRIGRIHARIANQRRDYLHKVSTQIANSFDIVCVENLNMKEISAKGSHHGKSTMDNGYGSFLWMLSYKLKDRGKYFVKVNRYYPSTQICSRCGRRKKLLLSERIYRCICGLEIDRDHNAAINIRNEGLRLLKAGKA